MQRLRQLAQLAFDFFDSASGPEALADSGKSGASAHPPDAASPRPVDRVAGVATDPGAVLPDVGVIRPEPLSAVVSPARFAHPRANRRAMLDGTHVAYEFRRARRRTIGFAVGPDGLVVSAPRWVPVHEVESALQEKARWIVRKLDEMRERQDRLAAARIEWRDGATFPFLGESVIVVLDPRHAFDGVGAVLHTATDVLPGVPRLTLHVGLAQQASADQIRDAVQAWLMRQARRLFTERLDHFAPRLGVRWRKLSLSSAATRWGSASADGAIRLNWRLIHFGLPVIDYVVAHELSHLRVMDHSPRFWDTVRTVVPDFDRLRERLRDETLPTW